MFRRLSIALISTLCFTSVVLAEDKPSPAVKRILDKAVGKVRANRTEFDKANKKPLDEARAELQDLSTKLIKDGKTQEAGDVLRQVGTLEADVMRMANAPPPVAGAGGPQKPLLERMAGKWESRDPDWQFFLEIRPDGVVRQITKASGRMGLEGRLTLLKPEQAEVTWSNGEKRYLLLAGEGVDAVLCYGGDKNLGWWQRAP